MPNAPYLGFDEDPELYERTRPGYTRELVDEVCEFAALTDSSRVLEVGCGTGKATRAFAGRVGSMLCLDPGPGLLEVARRECPEPSVEFTCCAFEDAAVAGCDFDLVMSAQAFHWVDQARGYDLAAQALRPGGAVALFWHQDPEVSREVQAALDRAYAACAPELGAHLHNYGRAPVPAAARIAATGAFGPVAERSYRVAASQTPAAFAALLGTRASHRRLGDAARAELLEAVEAQLTAVADRVAIVRESILFLARRLD